MDFKIDDTSSAPPAQSDLAGTQALVTHDEEEEGEEGGEQGEKVREEGEKVREKEQELTSKCDETEAVGLSVYRVDGRVTDVGNEEEGSVGSVVIDGTRDVAVGEDGGDSSPLSSTVSMDWSSRGDTTPRISVRGRRTLASLASSGEEEQDKDVSSREEGLGETGIQGEELHGDQGQGRQPGKDGKGEEQMSLDSNEEEQMPLDSNGEEQLSVDSRGNTRPPTVVDHAGQAARHERETDFPEGNDEDEPAEEEDAVVEDMAIELALNARQAPATIKESKAIVAQKDKEERERVRVRREKVMERSAVARAAWLARKAGGAASGRTANARPTTITVHQDRDEVGDAGEHGACQASGQSDEDAVRRAGSDAGEAGRACGNTDEDEPSRTGNAVDDDGGCPARSDGVTLLIPVTQQDVEPVLADDEELADAAESVSQEDADVLVPPALQEKYLGAHRRLIFLIKASLQKLREEGRLGKAKGTINPIDDIEGKGKFWLLAKCAVDFGGKNTLSTFSRLIQAWRADPELPRKQHLALRASPGAGDSGDEGVRHRQRSTPRRRTMGTVDPNGRRSQQSVSSGVELYELQSVARFHDTLATIATMEAADAIKYALRSNYMLNLSSHYYQAIKDLRMQDGGAMSVTTARETSDRAVRELFKHARTLERDPAKRDKWLKNTLKASERFARMATEFGRATFVFLKPAEMTEEKMTSRSYTDTHFECWFELIKEYNNWTSDRELRSGLDSLLDRFLGKCSPTDDHVLLAVETATNFTELAAALEQDPPSILRYKGYVGIEEVPGHRGKRMRGNDFEGLDSGLGNMYSTPERGDMLLPYPGEGVNYSLDRVLVQDENQNLTFHNDTTIANTYPGPQSEIDYDMDLSSSFGDLVDMQAIADYGTCQ